MAFDNFRPDFEYLKSLGFTQSGEANSDDFEQYFRMEFPAEFSLEMNGFHDFVVYYGNEAVGIEFTSEENLEKFIEHFKNKSW